MTSLPLDSNLPTLTPDHSVKPSSTTVDIRQKQFGFAQADSDKTELETGDVLTCMGLVAAHRESGRVFMMHLDVPWYDGSVLAALTELRDLCGTGSLGEVELYDVAGITPRMSMAASALVFCAFAWTSEGLVVGSIGFAAMLLSTRARTRWLLWRLGFKQPKLLTRRDAIGEPLKQSDFRINVRVTTIGDGAFVPVLTLPSDEKRDPRFLVTEPAPIAEFSWSWWRQKAHAIRAWCSGRFNRATNSN